MALDYRKAEEGEQCMDCELRQYVGGLSSSSTVKIVDIYQRWCDTDGMHGMTIFGSRRLEGSNTTAKAILAGGLGVHFFNEEDKSRFRQLDWPVGKTNEFNCIFRLPDKGGSEGFNLAPYTSWLPSDVGSSVVCRGCFVFDFSQAAENIRRLFGVEQWTKDE